MDCVSHQSRLFERSAHWPWSLYTTHAWRRARTVQSTAHRFTTTQQITENNNKHFIWDNRLQNCVYRLMLWSRVPIFVSPIPFWSHDHWWLFRGVTRTLRRGQHSWLVCNFTSMWWCSLTIAQVLSKHSPSMRSVSGDIRKVHHHVMWLLTERKNPRGICVPTVTMAKNGSGYGCWCGPTYAKEYA